jgi:ATPase subunit of ABC transporter with duplicated ATPase domains
LRLIWASRRTLRARRRAVRSSPFAHEAHGRAPLRASARPLPSLSRVASLRFWTYKKINIIMIEHVKIENLNGKYNYDLTFNRDINIITGRNGAGKTTLMKLLWAAMSGQLNHFINELYFDYFDINLFDEEKTYIFHIDSVNK